MITHSTPYDSEFGKRVLTYCENRRNLKYHQMDIFMATMKNYIFLERREPHLSENISFSMGTLKTFMWLQPGFPLFSPDFPVR